MSVKLRLKRFGAKARPYYRIVVIDTLKAANGKTLEEVGFYHPLSTEDKQVELKEDRIKEWLAKGAVPSDTVKRILNKNGIVLDRKAK